MIYIITQRDPFFIDAFLSRFDEFGVSYKVLDLPNFNKGFYSGLSRAFTLYGSLGVVKLILYYLQKQSSFKLKNMIESSSYANIEEAMVSLQSISDEDVILSLSAPCRIPIEKFPNKIRKYNIHCGKLPEYAGMMPIFWQILDGNSAITITIHDLAAEIDTGSILVETEMKILQSLFITSVRAKEKSAELFYNLLDKNLDFPNPKPRLKPIKLTKFPQKDDVKQFKKLMRLV